MTQRNEALKALRRLGLPLQEIADLVGLSQPSVCAITRGILPGTVSCCRSVDGGVKFVGRFYGHNAAGDAHIPVEVQ